MKTCRFLVFAAPACVGLALGTPVRAGEAPVVSLAPLIQEYEADRHDVSSSCDLPGSDIRFDKMATLYASWQKRLKTIPFERLPESGKVDYVLLRNDLEAGLDDLSFERKRWREMGPILPFHHAIVNLEQARWNNTPLNGQDAATIVASIVSQARDVRTRIELGLKAPPAAITNIHPSLSHSTTGLPLVVSASLAKRSAEATESLRATLKKWFAFHDGYRPEFSWWVKKPYEEADKSLEEYAKFLREDVAGLKGKEDDPLVGEPVGEAALTQAIRHEFLPYDAHALLAIGEREMAWCEHEMKAAARDMGFGDDWLAALTKVKSDFAAPGDQDSLINDDARDAIAFVKQHRLVTIPPLCEETWHLTMMSPETLKTIPYAAYGGQNMMVAYAREDMKHDDKLMTMRGNNRHFMRAVTPHELIPGHHLQRFEAVRYNQHRSLFGTPFYIEGWALYWERRFWDLGWAQTPEDRLGMLFWRMNRAARIEVSLKFHLGRMAPAEMVDFLVHRVGHERMGATSEVRRFISDGVSPLYQAAYMLGALQLEALRHSLMDNGTMSESQFNDAVLAENAIPVELIRAELLALPLTRDTQSTWKFAETSSPR